MLFLLLVVLAHASPTRAVEQKIYLSADVIDWNFAPGGELCSGSNGSTAAATWIGEAGLGQLKKAKFVGYTDESFQTPVPIPDSQTHLGLLGPLIETAPGDTLVVHVLNRLPFAINFDPSGLEIIPEDSAEFTALTTSPTAEPNTTAAVVSRWKVPDAAAPGADEPATKMWLYRSTVDSASSDNAGLLGPILVRRAGLEATPAGRDIVTVFQIINEGSSPFVDDNLQGRTAEDLGMNEEEFEETLLKHAINGFLFCNIPKLEMQQGEEVRWHSAGVGSEYDLHTSHWHGNTFLSHGSRVDQVMLVPGSARSMQMEARAAGTWLLHCHVNDHIHAGMNALYTVLPSTSVTAAPLNGTLRRHFIAAETVEWDYGPLGGNACAGTGTPAPFSEDELVFMGNATGFAGSGYLKAMYVEYTDATFTTHKTRDASDAYMGLLGPTMRAEVGDTLEVVFLNRLKVAQSVSMHPHGVAYSKSSEGAPYNDGSEDSARGDDAVPPGGNFTYSWTVPETAGPGPSDPSSIAWMYHSHSNEITDPYAGLVGVILVGRQGAFRRGANGTLGDAADVANEAVLLFAVMNERESFMWEANEEAIAKRDAAASASAKALGGRRLLAEADEEAEAEAEAVEEDEAEADLMHTINGFMYCNAPALVLPRGKTTRIHVIAIGTEVDLHTPTLVGAAAWENHGQRTAALLVLPGAMITADVKLDAEAPLGPAVLQCRVEDHITAGMQMLINVTGSPTAPPVAATDSPVREYFIAAEETAWDYVPLAADNCNPAGRQPFGEDAVIFTEATDSTIGGKFKKALYRRFADASFVQRVPVPASQGVLGPLLAAEVGETLKITFKNKLGFPANLHLEAPLVPLNGSADPYSPVEPGSSVTYILRVPESAAPGPADLSTVTYAYTSSADLVTHPMAGLVGIALIGKPGTFAAYNGTMPAVPVPSDVDAVLPLFAAILNENQSPYIEENMATAGVNVAAEGLAEGEAGEAAELFESNLKHSFNGYLYCNAPEFAVVAGAKVRVPVLNYGSEGDTHSIHVGGHVLKVSENTGRFALEPIMPARVLTGDIELSRPGVWPVTCIVHDHLVGGMQTSIKVVSDADQLESSASKPAAAFWALAALVAAVVLAAWQ